MSRAGGLSFLFANVLSWMTGENSGDGDGEADMAPYKPRTMGRAGGEREKKGRPTRRQMGEIEPEKEENNKRKSIRWDEGDERELCCGRARRRARLVGSVRRAWLLATGLAGAPRVRVLFGSVDAVRSGFLRVALVVAQCGWHFGTLCNEKTFALFDLLYKRVGKSQKVVSQKEQSGGVHSDGNGELIESLLCRYSSVRQKASVVSARQECVKDMEVYVRGRMGKGDEGQGQGEGWCT